MKANECLKMVDYVKAEDGSMMAEYEVFGYEIMVQSADYLPGGLRIQVTAPRKNRYAVDIYIDDGFGSSAVQKIRIQTSAWGAQEPDEIDKIIEAYRTAQAIARDIQREFPQCFGNKEESK